MNGSRVDDFSELQAASVARDYEQVIATAPRVLENPPDIDAHIETLRLYGSALIWKCAYERAMTVYREMELLCREHGKDLAIPMAYQVALFYQLGLAVAGDGMKQLLDRSLPADEVKFAHSIIADVQSRCILDRVLSSR